MVVYRTAALSLVATLFTTTTAGAVPVTEAGAHFFTGFGPLAGYNTEVFSTSGAIRNQASSAAGQGASNPQPSITGEVNANIASLGVFLNVQRGAGSVAATIFEGVRFVTPTEATLDNTLAGYTVALVGRISGDIEQSVSAFQPNTPIPDGARLRDGSGVTLTYFETLEERDDALTGGGETQRLASRQGAGPIDLVFAAPTPDPTQDPAPRFTGLAINQNAPFVPCNQRPEGVCITRDESWVNINIEDLSVASFGLGLAFTATLTDEIGTTGEIDAFNSFDLEGLVMVDPNGAILEGLFISDSGADLTLDAFRPDFASAVQPIPLPAGALLLPAALGALAMFRRRRAV